MYDFWDYCNAVRRNVLATTLFIAVVRVNETKFLSNLTLSSFSAGLDFGWGGDVCKRGGWKCMCGCWRFLVVRLCCKPGFRGGPGGNRRVGGPPPPWKADRDITGPNSCTCTARPLILATQGGTQVAHRYLSRYEPKNPEVFRDDIWAKTTSCKDHRMRLLNRMSLLININHQWPSITIKPFIAINY